MAKSTKNCLSPLDRTCISDLLTEISVLAKRVSAASPQAQDFSRWAYEGTLESVEHYLKLCRGMLLERLSDKFSGK